jgi:very-short-patch-repair endonuclease
MEKECDQCGIKYNTKNKKQKYCSVECQHNSYRKKTAERVKVCCQYCGLEFEERKHKVEKYGVKYCNKKCADLHKKTTYLKEGNPAFGTKRTEKQKNNASIRSKKLWKNEEYRNKIKNGIFKFIETNGYFPGTDENSKRKRMETMIERYGIPHNWVGKYGERECDKTTLEIYGKTSAQMLIDYSHYYNKKTDIEKMFEIMLEELEIPFQYKFRIYDKEKVDFWFREYDFLIINTNALIEVDGDYWHGNKNIFEELTDFQQSVKVNDEIKEKFANTKGYNVFRVWGSDIKKNNHEVKNKLKEIWEKLK